MKRNIGKITAFLAAAAAIVLLLLPGTALDAKAMTEDGKVVIAIDPGHGGPDPESSDNMGAIYAPYLEKDVNLTLARYVVQELNSYDNVVVVMTRNADEALSLKDRVEIAQNAGADFMISLHMNASETHKFYGTEVWTSAFDTYYAEGASFGKTLLAEYQEEGLGLYQRGIKTRIGQNGDYYGIIRRARAAGFPAVIIEHCYLDSAEDRAFLSDNSITKLAHADAQAIAKYFHLYSAASGTDYSAFERPLVQVPAAPVYQDTTPADICTLVYMGDDGNGNSTFTLLAADTDSVYPVLYYSVFLNGVESVLFPYNQAAGGVTFTLPLPSGTQVKTAAYSSYDALVRESNTIIVP